MDSTHMRPTWQLEVDLVVVEAPEGRKKKINVDDHHMPMKKEAECKHTKYTTTTYYPK